MAISFFDWQLYGPLFTDPQMADIFSEDATIAAWLRVEQALAAAEASLGMVPPDAAKAIGALTPDRIDKAALARDTEAVGRPIVGLVREMRRLLPDDIGRWVHHRGTTQDIMDTALALQVKEGLAELEEGRAACENALRTLSKAGAGMMMAGRTNGQHAQPIPFSHKVDRLVQEFRRHGERLVPLRDRVLRVQLGGAVGTLAHADDWAVDLKQAFGVELGLGTGEGTWQSSRDGIAETALWLSLVAQTVEKMGWLFGNLASSDLGEIRLRGAGGESSAMPHKNNPRDAEFTEALARLARQRALSIVETGRHEHERSGGVWIAEWMLVPEAFLLTSACLKRATALACNVQPDEERMADNLARSRGVLASEAVAEQLAEVVGAGEAKGLVSRACDRAMSTGTHLLEELRADPSLSTIVDWDEIERVIDRVYAGEGRPPY